MNLRDMLLNNLPSALVEDWVLSREYKQNTLSLLVAAETADGGPDHVIVTSRIIHDDDNFYAIIAEMRSDVGA